MDYPNTGSLWPNKFKKTDSQPSVKGSIKIEAALLQELIKESNGGLVEIEIAAWTKVWENAEGNAVKYLTLKASKPFKKESPKQSRQDDDDDVPF